MDIKEIGVNTRNWIDLYLKIILKAMYVEDLLPKVMNSNFDSN
jgi:hypothetical protein